MNQKFIDLQIKLHGKEKAENWLNKLPEIVENLKNKWNLKIGKEFDLTYNYVISATRNDGEKAVLKIYHSDDSEYLNQLSSLQIFNGEGAVKVWEYDNENYAILLEQCIPGDPLTILNDEEKEVLIFAGICEKIWKKPPVKTSFKNLSSESKYFDWYFKNGKKHAKYLPEEKVIKAANFFDDLIRTQGEQYLLHSDLHQDNILSSERGYLAIDPKGLIGEREYETASFIRNPFRKFKDEKYINKDFFAQRITLISKAFDFNEKRIAKWVYVKQNLSIIWDLQDFNDEDLVSMKILRELEKLI